MSDFNNISNSSGPGSSAEPSMEEILASIRRILKEDGGNLPAKVDIDDDVLLLDDSMLAEPADFSSATELPEAPAVIAPHPDAAGATFQQAGHFSSEPTFEVDKYAEDEVPAAVEPAHAETLLDTPAKPSVDALEDNLGDAPGNVDQDADRGTPGYSNDYANEYAHEDYIQDVDARAETPAPAADNTKLNQPQSEHATPEPSEVPERVRYQDSDQQSIYRSNPEEPMSENVEPPHGLLSEEASNAAANSIGSLVRSISADRSVAVSRGGITIEDIVREEIRPVLKAWMDTHLPSLVERLVRQEIERVVERGAG